MGKGHVPTKHVLYAWNFYLCDHSLAATSKVVVYHALVPVGGLENRTLSEFEVHYLGAILFLRILEFRIVYLLTVSFWTTGRLHVLRRNVRTCLRNRRRIYSESLTTLVSYWT